LRPARAGTVAWVTDPATVLPPPAISAVNPRGSRRD
jgi:hypothetical protein